LLFAGWDCSGFSGFSRGDGLRYGNGHLAVHDRLWKFKQDEVDVGGRAAVLPDF